MPDYFLHQITWNSGSLIGNKSLSSNLAKPAKPPQPILSLETADDVARHEDQAPEKRVVTFLDLPREIRDEIYGMVVIHDAPIELAPLIIDSKFADDDRYRKENDPHYQIDARGRNDHGGFTGHGFHFLLWDKEIIPSLALLRVSKRIYDEAGKMFYGRNEFRFSSPWGWPVLGQWLLKIRPKTRNMVRHITVGHPELCDLQYAMEILEYQHHMYGDLESCIPWSVPMLHRSILAQYYEDQYGSESDCYKEWLRESDPTDNLLSMTNLRTLRFLLIAYHAPLNYTSLLHHAISFCDWSAHGKLRRSVVNLVDNFGGRFTELPLDMIRNSEHFEAFRRSASPAPFTSDGPLRPLSILTLTEANIYFESMAKQGWKVEEMLYDNHYSYPVSNRVPCNDERVCRLEREKPGFCGEWSTFHSKNPQGIEWIREQFRACAYEAAKLAVCRLALDGFAQDIGLWHYGAYTVESDIYAWCELGVDHDGSCGVPALIGIPSYLCPNREGLLKHGTVETRIWNSLSYEW